MSTPKKEAGQTPAPATTITAEGIYSLSTDKDNPESVFEQVSEREMHLRRIVEAEQRQCEALARDDDVSAERFLNDILAEKHEIAFLDFWKAAAEWGRENWLWNVAIFAELKRTLPERIARANRYRRFAIRRRAS